MIQAQYPGASAEVVSNTVATPIEQEINGVEDMLYMSSQATGDGQLSITVTFALGTDVDEAQVLVQNRVAVAEPRLPEDVRRLGVTVRKSSPDILMVVQLFSPDNSRQQLYLANYATLQIRDALLRVQGVGDVRMPTSRDYAMVIWLDPDRVAARNLTAGEVVDALRAQNVQVAAGVVNQPPVPSQGAFQLNVETLGRLSDPAEFENIIVRTDADGRVTRVSDIARVELTAQTFRAVANFNGQPSQPIQILQQPGSNALDTAERVIEEMKRLGTRLPSASPTTSRSTRPSSSPSSVNEVYKTDPRGRCSRRSGRHPFPADVARRDRADPRDPDFAHRHLCRDGGAGLFAEQSVPARSRSGDRHRRRRCDRRRRERRAASSPRVFRPRRPRISSMDEISGALIAIALVLCSRSLSRPL